jgi:membrane protease YdiL (CAAX protease family)
MLIVATGQEPLPLRAWACGRLLLWYFGSQFGILFLLLLVAQLGLVFRGLPNGEIPPEHYLVAFAIAVPGSALVVLARLRRNLRGGSWPAILAALGWREVPRPIAVRWAVCGAGLAALYALIVIPHLLPPISQDIASMSDLLDAKTPLGKAALILLAVGIAPPLEEFFFRGILLSGFGASWGTWPAVAGSIACFALGHLNQVGSYWPAFLGIIIVAAVATGVRLRYRSLFPGIAMHAGYNGMLMALSLGGGS